MSKLLAVGIALSLFGAACGGDDGGGGDTTAAPSETTAAPSETTAPTETTAAPGGEGESALPEETGPADSSKEPVVIGFINNTESQPIAFPGSKIGFETAVELINAKLGGIGGRPVQVKACSANLDPTSVQQCAQEMANDPKVTVVATGFIVVGSDKMYEVLGAANKPILVGNPLNVADFTATNAVSYYPGNPGITAGLPVFAVDFLGAKKLAVVVSDNDAGRSAIQLVQTVLAQDGVEIKPVFVKDNEVDYTGPITAAGANDADVFLPLVAQPGCIQVAKALDTLGIKVPVASTGLCGDRTVLDAVGELVEGWYIGFNGVPSNVGEGKDPEADYYNQAFAEFDKPENATLSGATGGFGSAMALWSIGNTIGADKLDSASWLEGMKAFTGPVFLGPRSVKCPGPTFPAVCTTQMRVFQIKDGTPSVDATDGVPVDTANRS